MRFLVRSFGKVERGSMGFTPVGSGMAVVATLLVASPASVVSVDLAGGGIVVL